MGRLLILLTTALLCIAGTGLASAAVVPIIHQSSAARPATVSPRGSGILPDSAPISPPPSDSHLAADTTPVSSVADRAEVPARVKQATQAVLPNAQVGFEVFDRVDSTTLTSDNADHQFAAMSVVKLLIALDVLSRDAWATPDSGTRQELHQMLANSDDQIASTLWTAGGGPAIVTRMISVLGLDGTRPPGDPGEWGDTLITPDDMVTVYRYITDQLPKPDQDVILGALADTPKVAADGFDQYFGIPYSNDMNPRVLLENTQVVENPAQLDTLTARYTGTTGNALQATLGAGSQAGTSRISVLGMRRVTYSPSLATTSSDVPAERASCPPLPGLSSTLCTLVPSGTSPSGSALPSRTSEPGPERTLSPTARRCGARM